MVRIGIIGLGNMGSGHLSYLSQGEVKGAELTAVCDVSPERLQRAKNNTEQQLLTFNDPESMMRSGSVDAVLIATPHYDHPALAIKAFRQDLHVMIEKPAGVYTKQVREMNEAAVASGKVFGIMYNMRRNALFKKLKDLVDLGELGELKRINWIITNWYRPQSYYNSGGWRATWSGEGGGVLINQAPHQLDIWQWIFGLPHRVRAHAGFGKYHDIEVEDDVTAYMEYENGVTGVLITSTGDAPGTNRLEVSANNGKVVIEDGKLTFWRLRVPERDFNRDYKGGMGSPECWKIDVPIDHAETGHKGLTQNWVDSIRNGTPLIAPGIEGIRGLELSNAMHLSAWTDSWAKLPLDENLFHEKLQENINNSTITREVSL